MNRKQRRIVINHVSKQFNGIYTTAKRVCKEWETNIIPINAVSELIDIAKYSEANTLKKDLESGFIKVLAENHNNTCESLKKALIAESNRMNSKGVSLEYLKACVDLVIKNFTDSLNGK